MSEENVDLARNAWTPDSFLGLFDEYIVSDSREHPVPGLRDIAFGQGQVTEAFIDYWRTWDDYAIEPIEFIDAGQSVVVTVRERGTGKGSGVPVERPHFQVWTFRRGKLVRWEAFRSKVEALEAAGLSE
jgi:ketosteroid isomerase-like protein